MTIHGAEINEAKIDKLASTHIKNHVRGTVPQGHEAYIEFAEICYKAGYRKAMEEACLKTRCRTLHERRLWKRRHR